MYREVLGFYGVTYWD